MIQTICICGAGTMGRSIAQSMSSKGFATILFDLHPEVLEQAEAFISAERSAASARGITLSGNAPEYTTTIHKFPADLFIEAIVEDADAKIKLYRQILQAWPNARIASNTSSLSISELAEAVTDPGLFAGMHFFNPAHKMKLVELIAGKKTSPAFMDELHTLTLQLNKIPVRCTDAPGFIVNRVARPYYLEALQLAETTSIPLHRIDDLMEQTGFRMGPFRLMDLIGNDINFTVSCSVWEALHRPPRLQPSALQQQLVKEGRLGRKSGHGYYDYDNPH